MTLAYAYDGGAMTHDVEPSGISIPQRADMGEKSMGGIPLEDPSASLTMLGHRPFIVTESACTTQPRLFTGYVAERGIGRSLDRGMFVGPDARLHDLTIVDSNAIFGFRQITGVDGNRGAETWGVRLSWILGSAYLTGLISTNETWVIDSVLPMEAADYRKGYPSAVLGDLADRITKPTNWFAFWDATEVRLFFDYDTETIGDCTKRISNVVGDINSSTTFAPDSVATLAREPDQTYSGVTVEYANGSVYRHRASTAATYIARDTTISRPYTGAAATAQLQAELFLDAHAVEVDRITCSIQVPAVSVGLIRAGQRISVKFSHMPGYSAFTWMRIVACSPKPTNDKADFYDVALELVGPRPATTTPNLLVAFIAEWTGTYTPLGCTDLSAHGWTKVINTGDVANPAQYPGPGRGSLMEIWYRRSVAGESGANVLGAIAIATGGTDRLGAWVYELACVGNPSGSTVGVDTVYLNDAATVSMAAAVSSVLIGGSVFQKVDYGQVTLIGLTDGTILRDVNLNDVGGGTCHVTGDNKPPRMWMGYRTGTGTLTAGGTMDCLGATGPEYNLMGRGYGAILLPLTGTFSVVQYAHGYGPGGSVYVSLAAAPGSSAGSIDTTGTLPPPPLTTHTTNPTVDDDSDAGYGIGDAWVNTATGEAFVCVDNTNGAAVWTSTTSTGSWAPTTADYLVGTAQAGLSAEIVVGTTPGGELGGTWASPTVDATHAGSAHLALGSTSSTAAAGDHAHTAYVGELLITDTPAGSPLVFADLLQNEAGDELLYAG